MKIEEYRKLYGSPGTSKYKNKKTMYGGVLFDSQREAQYAQDLDLRVRAGDLKSWRRQVPIELIVNGHLIYRYRIDFVEVNNDGSEVWTEIKSEMTAKLRDFVIVWRLFHALFPERKKQIII